MQFKHPLRSLYWDNTVRQKILVCLSSFTQKFYTSGQLYHAGFRCCFVQASVESLMHLKRKLNETQNQLFIHWLVLSLWFSFLSQILVSSPSILPVFFWCFRVILELLADFWPLFFNHDLAPPVFWPHLPPLVGILFNNYSWSIFLHLGCWGSRGCDLEFWGREWTPSSFTASAAA